MQVPPEAQAAVSVLLQKALQDLSLNNGFASERDNAQPVPPALQQFGGDRTQGQANAELLEKGPRHSSAQPLGFNLGFAEPHRLALQALGSACSKGSNSLSPEALRAALVGLLSLLRQSTEGPLVVSAAASRFYETLLRTLHTLLTEVCQ